MTGLRVAIVGAGWEAWLMAALLRTFLRGAAEIVVVGRDAPSALPVVATTPAVHDAHRLLRADKADFGAVGTPRLGTLVRPLEGRAPFFVPFGKLGGPELRSGFAEQWLRLRAAGRVGLLADYDAAEAVAARPDRPIPAAQPFAAAVAYGLHLEPAAYRDALRTLSMSRGVRWISDDPVALDRDASGWNTGIALPGGERVAADWFIDASEQAGALAERLAGAHWLHEGGDRLETEAGTDGSLRHSVVERAGDGWRWTTAVAGAVRHTLVVSARGGREITWRRGRLGRAWTANVLAIGSAQRRLCPFEPLAHERVARAAARFTTLFPTADTLDAIVPEYERQLALDDAAMDMAGGAIEQLVAHPDRPGPLHDAALLFERTGRLPQPESDPFGEDQWLALFVGAGLSATRYDPNADRLDFEAVAGRFERWAAAVKAL